MGGGGTTTNAISEFKPPDYTQQGWKDYLGQSQANASQPYSPFAGMRQAPLNDMQNTGLQGVADLALNGSPTLNSAKAQNLATSNGQFLDNNPYASNKYTDNVIANNAGNMSTAFANGTAAQNDALANQQGAYGGSGWAQKQSTDAMGLARSVGQMADQTRMNQTNLAAGMYGDERNRMMQAGQAASGFDAGDMSAMKALTGAGDAYQANTQKGLDQAYADYQDQLGYNKGQTDYFGNALSRASGSGNSTTQSGPGQSPLGLLGGLGMGVYGASKFF